MSNPRTVVSVTFDGFGRTGHYAIDPRSVSVVPGAWVVVESGRGKRLGRVTAPPERVDKGGGRIRKVVRLAGREDLERQAAMDAREPEAFRLGLAAIRERRLPLKLVRVALDAMAKRATYCVIAPDTLELDALGGQLSEALDLRVTFRQLGARDVAKVLGGVGRCGRELCCSTHLQQTPRTSVRMAKDQGMSLIDDRASGVCGRTLCCLAYEQEFYKERRGFLPKLGKRVATADGELSGKCVGVDVMRMEYVLLDEGGQRHRLPAPSWERNQDRNVPPPVTEDLATDEAEPHHEPPRQAPPTSAGPTSASGPAPRPPRRPAKRRRRRKPKRKPDS